MVEWMGQNFDVFPGFQKFLAMRNIVLYSVCPILSDFEPFQIILGQY